MKSLLVELFVEELPPKALRKLGEAFADVLCEQLRLLGLADAGATSTAYASPRRLAVHLTNVADRAADKAVSQKLMPVAVGLDAAGNATPALLRRLAALGADASAVPALRRAPDGKGEALFHDSTARGATLAEGLQKALAEAIAKLPIPKVMSYQLESNCERPGWSSVSFVRPAHGLVALHGDAVVAVSVLGLNAGRETHGHRFEARVDPIRLPDADGYAAQLADDGAVIASFDERRAAIERQLQDAAASLGDGAQPIRDDALLDEVTALVERPNVLVCAFDAAFLEVPAECLILTMKANQKYFPLLDAQGRLTNRFLVVSNISPDDASAVIEGNERVVRPRLADAKFFFDQDRRKTLAARVPGLAKVVYHNRLGTQAERSERVRAIATSIAARLGDAALVAQADTAARLAKADLLTDMVGEFPELQGVMGGYYARHDGLGDEVALAIEDHYRPRFAGDELPRNMAGTVVALADKLETLTGLFGIGATPTGDRDPFALRRHALGIARMLMEKDLPLELQPTLRNAYEIVDRALSETGLHAETKVFSSNPSLTDGAVLKVRREVHLNALTPDLLEEFFHDRLTGLLRDQGYEAREIDAVLALRPQRLGRVPQLLAAVRAFAELPEAPALAAANKRIGNLLKKSSKSELPEVDPSLLHEAAEQTLCAAVRDIVPRADALFEAGDYTASLQALAALRAPVDAFFDAVMVNAEDPALRRNRLALLHTLHRAMNRVADLSRLA